MTEKLKFSSKKFTVFARDAMPNAHPRDLAVLAELCRGEIAKQAAVVQSVLSGSQELQVDLVDTE